MKFVVFKKEDKDVSKEENLLLNECKKRDLVLDESNPDIVFVLGGDGTFLKAVHHYLDRIDSLKFIGIRCGTLGFFYDFNKDEVVEAVDLLVSNKCTLNSYKLLQAKVGKETIYALNEIGIARSFHSIECLVKINNIELERFNGNGLLVCSPIGSSGYNKSLGGALLDHNLDALELSEISSIQNNLYKSLNSPLVLKGDSIITFEGNFNKIKIGYDNKTLKCIEENVIEIKYSNKVVNIIRKNNKSGLDSIKRSFIK